VYRFRAHGGAGDDSKTGYRSETERLSWEVVDPLHLFRKYVTQTGCLDDTMTEQMEKEIGAEIADAFEYAIASPNPSEEDLYRHVYAD
jgi:TPP-dependent pyruvate/acetoin dehydrogenase alpha subunit